jgi:hypothetical protein
MKALAILVLAAGLPSLAPPLPAPHRAIALSVAGEGLPACRSYPPGGGEEPCLPQFAVRRGGTVNGWSRGARITFTAAATTRLSRDEFALLAGHEIAHWYLGHRGSTPQAELAADRLGAQLACRAGFNVAAGASLFRHLAPSKLHPPATQRRAAVLEAGCGDGEEEEG